MNLNIKVETQSLKEDLKTSKNHAGNFSANFLVFGCENCRTTQYKVMLCLAQSSFVDKLQVRIIRTCLQNTISTAPTVNNKHVISLPTHFFHQRPIKKPGNKLPVYMVVLFHNFPQMKSMVSSSTSPSVKDSINARFVQLSARLVTLQTITFHYRISLQLAVCIITYAPTLKEW